MKLKFSYKLWIYMFVFFNIFSVFGIEAPLTNSKAAIVMDSSSGTILYDKNITSKIYPASITKILTGILALENLDLTQNVVVSKTAIQIPWDSSSVYLKEGEIISVEELLYCLLLHSGNDAANVLAEAVSGTIQDFVELMNKKALELGCTGTNFVNAHGYSHDNHYTTALDIAKIFNYCIQNDEFVKIISTKLYIVPETNKTTNKRYLYNTNRLILTKEESKHSRYYEFAIGGKTGFTNEAGKTLVTLGKKEDKTLIVAVFKAGTVDGLDARYTDAINLFNYSFDNFNYRTFANKENYIFNYTNYNTNLKTKLIIADNLELLIKNDDQITDVSYTLDLDENKIDKITKNNFSPNEDVGNITFTINTLTNSYTSTHDLIVSEIKTLNIIKEPKFTSILIIIIIILIAIISVIAKLQKRKNKKVKQNNTYDSSKISANHTINRKAKRTIRNKNKRNIK